MGIRSLSCERLVINTVKCNDDQAGGVGRWIGLVARVVWKIECLAGTEEVFGGRHGDAEVAVHATTRRGVGGSGIGVDFASECANGAGSRNANNGC